MKRILVPCDFSKPSQEAFKLAVSMAAKTSGEVIVLHVVYVPMMYDPSLAGGTPLAFESQFLSQMEGDVKKTFEKMKKDWGSDSVKTTLELSFQEIISAIKHTAENKHVDLVVMGTTGASGAKEVFIGSNTEKAVRHSPVPVLAVRTAPKVETIKNILLPTTGDLNQPEFIRKLRELQNFFQATLHILLINTPQNFRNDANARITLDNFANQYKLANYKLHFRNYRNEEDGIINFANDEGIDLVTMATHARKGLSHLFHGSITENVVNHILCPIWTYAINDR